MAYMISWTSARTCDSPQKEPKVLFIQNEKTEHAKWSFEQLCEMLCVDTTYVQNFQTNSVCNWLKGLDSKK